MIRLEDFRNSFDWKRKALITGSGKTETYEAAQKLKTSEARDSTVLIRVVSDVGMQISEPTSMVEDFHELFSPLVASVRGQSELVSEIQAWTFKPSEKRRKSAKSILSLDMVVALEREGEDSAKFIAEQSINQISSINVLRFGDFIIRILRMTELRGLACPNVTPAAILHISKSVIKLSDGVLRNGQDSELSMGANAIFSTLCLRLTTNHAETRIYADDWRLNERYSAAITLFQHAARIKLNELENMRRDGLKGKTERIQSTINSLQHFPLIANLLTNLVTMLNEEVSLDAMHLTLENNPSTLSTECFKVKSSE